jgi:hypothetical protein
MAQVWEETIEELSFAYAERIVASIKDCNSNYSAPFLFLIPSALYQI